jgi:ribosome modulation factor
MDEFERQQRAYERGEAAYSAGRQRNTNPESDDLLRAAWFAGCDRVRELDDKEGD